MFLMLLTNNLKTINTIKNMKKQFDFTALNVNKVFEFENNINTLDLKNVIHFDKLFNFDLCLNSFLSYFNLIDLKRLRRHKKSKIMLDVGGYETLITLNKNKNNKVKFSLSYAKCFDEYSTHEKHLNIGFILNNLIERRVTIELTKHFENFYYIKFILIDYTDKQSITYVLNENELKFIGFENIDFTKKELSNYNLLKLRYLSYNTDDKNDIKRLTTNDYIHNKLKAITLLYDYINAIMKL